MPPISTPHSTPAPDPVRDPLVETQIFWARHQRTIIVVLSVVVLAIIAYGAYSLYQNQREAAASRMLSSSVLAGNYQQLIEKYPGTSAAASAYLLMAGELRREKRYAEANTVLQSFLAKYPDHQLVTAGMMGIAVNLDSMGKPAEAIEQYRQVAAQHPKSYNAPLALIAQIPLLRQIGKLDEARQVAETVLTQYRDSYAAGDASRYLRMLKPPAPPVGTLPTEKPQGVPDVSAAPSAPEGAQENGSAATPQPSPQQ